MQDIQEIFNQTQELKKEQKLIRREYADSLANDSAYEEITEELKQLREKKKQIETAAQQAMGSRWDDFEKNKVELASFSEMISDIAMTTLMDGKSVGVKDVYENEYEPIYRVTFKKIK